MGGEVEAHTTSEAVHELLLLLVSELLVLVEHQLQLHDLLSLELVLHEVPDGDTTVGRNRVEAKVLGTLVVGVPLDLPDGVSVLGSAHSREVDGLVVRLETNVKDHDGTIVATDS